MSGFSVLSESVCGTLHGTNEYAFLIDEQGFSVLPITSLGLDHEVSEERTSTGVPRLDAMLGGGGVYRGSSVLLSGTAGTGKTSLAAHFADASCRRGERCLYLASEESPGQQVRNLRSIGLDLASWLDSGPLRLVAARPTSAGLEAHLAALQKQLTRFKPALVVVDPISNFTAAGSEHEASQMLVRLVDFLKATQTTAVLTNLVSGGDAAEATRVGLSSIVDTWLLLRDIELARSATGGSTC